MKVRNLEKRVIVSNNSNLTDSCCCTQPHYSDNINVSNPNVFEAAEYDIALTKGTTFELDVTYKDASKEVCDLTGYTAKFVAQHDDVIITFDTEIIDAKHGAICVSMSAEDSLKIYTHSYKYKDKTEYNYNLDLTSPDGYVYRIMQGILYVTPKCGRVDDPFNTTSGSSCNC